jgi:hypothetical protein
MAALLPFVFLAAVLGFFTWLASRMNRRGLAGGAMSAVLATRRRSALLVGRDAAWAAGSIGGPLATGLAGEHEGAGSRLGVS